SLFTAKVDTNLRSTACYVQDLFGDVCVVGRLTCLDCMMGTNFLCNIQGFFVKVDDGDFCGRKCPECLDANMPQPAGSDNYSVGAWKQHPSSFAPRDKPSARHQPVPQQL